VRSTGGFSRETRNPSSVNTDTSPFSKGRQIKEYLKFKIQNFMKKKILLWYYKLL